MLSSVFFCGSEKMKRVLSNIFSFAKKERTIFAIIVICVVSSAFIINFSYGLYYNYRTQKNETELELKTLNPEIMQEIELF